MIMMLGLSVMGTELTGKTEVDCFQAYPGRGARIQTRLDGDRVKLRGQSVTVIEGTFKL